MTSTIATRASTRWTRRALFVIAMLAWPACGEYGEVAATGMCPSGEVCGMSRTGVEFRGTQTTDRVGSADLLTTAVGGRQVIGIDEPAFSDFLPTWHAVSGNPRVLVIESQDDQRITVRGIAVGSAYIRILDRDDALLDRVSVDVRELTQARLMVSWGVNRTGWRGPFAFMHGTRQSVFAQLRGDGSGRLVDIDATFTPASAPSVTPTGWDSAMATFPSEGDSHELFFDTGAGERLAMEAALVDGIDSIEHFEPPAEGGSISMIAGRPERVCFVARQGEVAVLGAALTVEGPPAITAELTAEGPLSCLSLSSETPGEYELELSGPGASLTVPVSVTSGS